jgi:hypothetical protein
MKILLSSIMVLIFSGVLFNSNEKKSNFDYDAAWENIKQLFEQEGKIQTAQAKVEEIYQMAVKEKNVEEQYAAIQYKVNNLFRDEKETYDYINKELANLTPFERNYAKRLIPFYTFMKNNMLFQAKNIVQNPNQYAKLLRGYKHWTEGMTDMDINELPEYMVQNMWVPFPTIVDRGDGETINFIKANLPPSDFAELISKPFSKAVTSLTVPLKLGIELGTGRDTFTGAPLREFPGQVNRMEAGTGVLPGFRGEDGEAYLSGDPVIQKIADDLGLRNPRKLVTAILDIADVTTGKQSLGKFVDDLGRIGGITTTKNLSEIELTSLYQKLEELRNLKKLYEQQTGSKLPTQAELQKRAGYQYKPK